MQGSGGRRGATRPHVGLAGLGRMGSAMAGRLADAGMLAGVYNRTWATCRERASQLDVQPAKTPAELAAMSDIVVTVLADGHALREVYEGGDGLLDRIRPGTLCVEMSTTGPAPLDGLSAQLQARDCGLVDAPVSGSVEMAAAGQLTVLAGGEQRLVDRAQPVFACLGQRTFHLGPLGAGAAMKLAVNNVVYGINQSVAESLVLAERAGIDRLLAYDVFAHSAAAAPFVHYRRAFFEHPGSRPPQMSVDLAAKDLALIGELAARVGAPLPQGDLNHGLLRQAAAAGYSDADVTAVAEHLRNQTEGENDGAA
jgi:3-hydroxyisobutyrate dehydrogenase-like beta-hydroxyacid dehydrogenase